MGDVIARSVARSYCLAISRRLRPRAIVETTLGAPEDERFTGVTAFGAHGRLGVDAMLVMKAARYVRFTLGSELSVLTDHLITGEPDCGSSDPRADDETHASACAEDLIQPCTGRRSMPPVNASDSRMRFRSASSLAPRASSNGSTPFAVRPTRAHHQQRSVGLRSDMTTTLR